MLAASVVPSPAQPLSGKPWTISWPLTPNSRPAGSAPAMPEPTLNTKYGQLTGREWIRSRFYAEFNDWLTPQALHYIFTRTPALDHNDKPIYHPDFENLVRWQPDAARNQLIGEAHAFFAELPERDRKRADFQAQQRQQVRDAVKAHSTKRRRKHAQPPIIPGL